MSQHLFHYIIISTPLNWSLVGCLQWSTQLPHTHTLDRFKVSLSTFLMLGPVWHPALLIRILLMTHILCLCSIALTWLKIRKYIYKDPLQVAHSSPCRRPMALHWSLCDVCAVSKLTFVQTEYCIFITEFKRQFHPPYLNQVESFLCFPDNMIIFPIPFIQNTPLSCEMA